VAGLLILGSKPDPHLPPSNCFTEVACANGSGYSASRHALPTPSYTLMSAILTSVESGTQSLAAIAGLKTGTLYYYPRPRGSGKLLKRLRYQLRTWSMRPAVLKRRLRDVGFTYDEFLAPGIDFYSGLTRRFCGGDEAVMEQVARKQLSTGMAAVMIGLSMNRFDRLILSGFSFELTHAYGANPEIADRGTRKSGHASTDIAVLRCLSRDYGNIFTSEPVVSERAGIPLIEACGDSATEKGARGA
jgi:hypothetical protein